MIVYPDSEYAKIPQILIIDNLQPINILFLNKEMLSKYSLPHGNRAGENT